MCPGKKTRPQGRSEAIRGALARKRGQHRRWWGGTVPPYGYRLADDGDTVLPVEAEQVVIRQLRRWRRAGRSYRAIAAELTARGIPTKTGRGPWHAAQVRKIVVRGEL